MSWAADYTEASDLAYVGTDGLLYQIWYALDERAQISGGSTYKLPVAGGKVFSAASTGTPTNSSWPPDNGASTDIWSIKTAQQAILARCSSFVRNPAAGAFDGLATPYHTYPEVYSNATLLTDAGLNSTGFTRRVPHANGDGGYDLAYGYFTSGDYVGPHLFNEMKACLKLLSAVFKQTFSQQTGREGREGYASGYSNVKTWAQLIATAEANFDADGNTFLWDYPFAITEKDAYQQSSTPPHPYLYVARMDRSRYYFYVTLTSTVQDTDIDFYACADGFTTFDGNGDFTADKHWQLSETKNYTAGASNPVVTSNFTGTTATTVHPTWCSNPPNGSSTAQGYIVQYSFSVLRYEGHLVYGST